MSTTHISSHTKNFADPALQSWRFFFFFNLSSGPLHTSAFLQLAHFFFQGCKLCILMSQSSFLQH